MKRSKMEELIAWKNSSSRKPLIIKGSRQVGKTWLMKEFGEKNYSKVIYLNLEKNKRLKSLFADDFDIQRIITALQAETGSMIDHNDTLLIFDEIQSVPEAISALKYFHEDVPDFHIVAAGSLLGVALHANISFPVGHVDFMDLYPMTFTEFLDALGENSLINLLESKDWKLITAFKSKFIERLKQYYFVGGMPEAVLKFSEAYNFTDVREIQKNILLAYEQDFSKYPPLETIPRIRGVWNSIPGQLAKENRKFIYGLIKTGSRAKNYEVAISWLIDCGLVHKIHRVNKPAIPLKAYEDFSAFKLFIADVGLLSAMNDIDARTLLDKNVLFTEFKGALTEQFVLQHLKCLKYVAVYYWSAERSTAEVDFVLQHNGRIVPVEVKAEENLQAKSLNVFSEKYHPEMVFRISMSDFRQKGTFYNLPLYAISNLEHLLSHARS